MDRTKVSILLFPADIMRLICSYLSAQDIGRLRCVFGTNKTELATLHQQTISVVLRGYAQILPYRKEVLQYLVSIPKREFSELIFPLGRSYPIRVDLAVDNAGCCYTLTVKCTNGKRNGYCHRCSSQETVKEQLLSISNDNAFFPDTRRYVVSFDVYKRLLVTRKLYSEAELKDVNTLKPILKKYVSVILKVCTHDRKRLAYEVLTGRKIRQKELGMAFASIMLF